VLLNRIARHPLDHPTPAYADFKSSHDLDFPRSLSRSLSVSIISSVPPIPHAFYRVCSSPVPFFFHSSLPLHRASWLTGRLIEQTSLILQPARDCKIHSLYRRSCARTPCIVDPPMVLFLRHASFLLFPPLHHPTLSSPVPVRVMDSVSHLCSTTSYLPILYPDFPHPLHP